MKSPWCHAIVAFALFTPWRDIRAAVDWPQFRGPNGGGVSNATDLPIQFGPQQNVIWKTIVPRGHSSPVLAGDRLFLTAFEGKQLLTFCLDRRTGAIQWKRQAPRSRFTKSQGANTPATPSPVTDGQNVFVFFEDFGLISYGPDGRERWRHPLGPFNSPYGMAASPVLADGKVLLLCDQDTNSFLLAVDKDDGRVRWKTERPEATHGFSTPAIYRPLKGPAQVVVSGAYELAGYSVDSGEKLWWVRGMAWQAKSAPIVEGDMAYVHSWMASPSELGLKDAPPFEQALQEQDANKDRKLAPEEVPDPEIRKLWFLFDLNKDGYMDEREWNIHRARGSAGNGLFAIGLGGRGDLTETGVLWKHQKSLPKIPSPLLYHNVLYILREGGILTALNPETGEVRKQGRIEGALDPYYASPIAADDKIYTVSHNGKVAVLKAGGLWEILAVNDLGEECWATPAMDDHRLYVRTRSALYCFGKPQTSAPSGKVAEIIPAIKEIQQTLGFQKTENFLNHSDKIKAYYRCYYTGKLELPSSYDELQLKYGTEAGCEIDRRKYDVFFYPIEAVASGNSPVTSSLAKSTLERVLMVVPHEDFHEDERVQKLPSTMGEAAATLVGFLTAAEFAGKTFGIESEVHRNLSKEAALFSKKAEIVNRYHQKLSALYRSIRSRATTTQKGLALKTELLAQMERECKAIEPRPRSFNECPGAINNAGVAFDATYAKHYPLFYELFLALGEQIRPTIEAVKGVAAGKSRSETDAVKLVREIIEQQKQPALSSH